MQDDEVKTQSISLFSKFSMGYLLILYLTPAADLIDLAILVPSLVVFWRLSIWFSPEIVDRLGRISYYIFVYLFITLFTVRLNRVWNYGFDSEFGFSRGVLPLMLGMSILCVIFVALGVSAYLLFRLKIKGIVLMIVPVFFLMVMDISSHATRQMVGQSMYGIDIKRAVVTKIPYAEGPIILTFEGGIPVVNEIMLPHGSWTQDITISSFLIHMFYEGE